MSPRVGLALAGGGARGAYQVGVIKAYVEQGGRVDVLAGSSVGAINAAVLASAPSLAEGVERLERIWLEEMPLLRFVLTLDEGLGLREDLKKLLNTHLDPMQLAKGPPVYVSLYESKGNLRDGTRWLLAEKGILDTPRSRFVRLQSRHTPAEQLELILASAAFPFLFSARIDGERKADGGIGGWRTSQGNTPVDPLVNEGCEVVIVSHLGADSRWSRDKYPNLTVVEITPGGQIGNGSFSALFERDPKVLRSWLTQGYQDATRQLGRIREAIEARNTLAESEHAVADSEDALKRAAARRRDAMTQLNKRSD